MSGRRKLSADVVRVSRRFENWRSKRTIGDRIPDTLWRAAVQLACKHGVAQVTAALRLDYYALKKRVKAMQTDEPDHTPVEFVELNAPVAAVASEYTIELEHPEKGSMRISIRGGAAPSVVELGREFWRDA